MLNGVQFYRVVFGYSVHPSASSCVAPDTSSTSKQEGVSSALKANPSHESSRFKHSIYIKLWLDSNCTRDSIQALVEISIITNLYDYSPNTSIKFWHLWMLSVQS